MRSWRDVTGRIIQAEFVLADDKTATLRMNGKNYALALEQLSPEDRQWIIEKTATAKAKPTAASTKPAEEASIGGKPFRPGTKMEFEVAVSPALKARADRINGGKDLYKDADMTKALVGIFTPDNFDPSKSWPIMIVSVTDSGRAPGKGPSSVKSIGGYIDAAKQLGWVVIGVDCPGYLTPGAPGNRAALAEAGLDAMAAHWPASKDWPVATGGFSGGAKYSGWLGGWFSKGGRRVLGMFMSGCNEDMAALAISEWRVPKTNFNKAKVFVSTGEKDNVAGPEKTVGVIRSLKKSGFEVKEMLHTGGHGLDKEHVLAAMTWFSEDTPASNKK